MIILESLELTETQAAMLKLAKDFAENEIKPVAALVDRAQDFEAPDAFPWEMVKKAYKVGLKTLTLPREYGGPEEKVDLITQFTKRHRHPPLQPCYNINVTAGDLNPYGSFLPVDPKSTVSACYTTH